MSVSLIYLIKYIAVCCSLNKSNETQVMWMLLSLTSGCYGDSVIQRFVYKLNDRYFKASYYATFIFQIFRFRFIKGTNKCDKKRLSFNWLLLMKAINEMKQINKGLDFFFKLQGTAM